MDFCCTIYKRKKYYYVYSYFIELATNLLYQNLPKIKHMSFFHRTFSNKSQESLLE